jgi:hypothetical protein
MFLIARGDEAVDLRGEAVLEGGLRGRLGCEGGFGSMGWWVGGTLTERMGVAYLAF